MAHLSRRRSERRCVAREDRGARGKDRGSVLALAGHGIDLQRRPGGRLRDAERVLRPGRQQVQRLPQQQRRAGRDDQAGGAGDRSSKPARIAVHVLGAHGDIHRQRHRIHRERRYRAEHPVRAQAGQGRRQRGDHHRGPARGGGFRPGFTPSALRVLDLRGTRLAQDAVGRAVRQ